MGPITISRLRGIGLVVALSLMAIACGGGGGDGDGGGQNAGAAGFNSAVRSLAPDGSGDLYVGGAFTSYKGTPVNRVVRLNVDGTVDVAFDTGTGFNGDVTSLAPDGSGNLYVGGFFTSYNGTVVNRVVRLTATGTVDGTFATGSGTGFNDAVFSLAPDGSGDLYVGGNFTSYNGTPAFRVVRLNVDGTVDGTFATGTGFNGDVTSLAPDGSGNLYVGGFFTSYKGVAGVNRVVRLTATGTVDGTFATGAGFNDRVFSLAPDGSGNLYVGGAFSSYNVTPAFRVVRLTATGTVDGTFATGAGFNGDVLSLAPDGSGNLYVGGAFTTYKGVAGVNRVVRLTATGTVDGTFATGAGFNGDVLSLAPDVSGDLYVGGAFTSYQSTTLDNFARLNPDGSVD